LNQVNEKYKTAAIVSAMPEELEYVHEYLDGRQGWRKAENNSYENKEQNLRIITQIMGVGKVNAACKTTDIIHDFHPDIIINVGYAGGLIKSAHRGDVAVGTEYVQADFRPYFDKNRPEIAKSPKAFTDRLEEEAKALEIPVFKGKIATGDFFLHSTEQKNSIIAEFSPIAFDMESAACALAATLKSVPFVALRTFSDLADDSAVDTISRDKTDESRIPIERRPIVLAVNTLEKSVALL
jgi:adenosylhomocysteine nucleosidase